MLLFRSLALGLLGAILFLVAEPRHVAAPAAAAVVDERPTIIDVAPGVAVTTVPSLVHLEPGEWVVAIDDRPVHDDFEAGTMLAAGAGKRFFDLTVAGHGSSRRVLVLMH